MILMVSYLVLSLACMEKIKDVLRQGSVVNELYNPTVLMVSYLVLSLACVEKIVGVLKQSSDVNELYNPTILVSYSGLSHDSL